MKLRSLNPRNSYTTVVRQPRSDEIFVLVTGDYGVIEYVVGAQLEKRRELAVGPVAFAERNALGDIAIVGSGTRPEFNHRRVCIVGNDGTVIASKQFKSPVLAVQFSSKGHVAVICSDCVYWFKYLEKEAVKSIPTMLNMDAICAISDDGHLLAVPIGPSLIGVWHGSEQMLQISTAGGCSKLRFNPRGAGQDLLAATSDGGKSVWVWSLNRIDKKATLKFEFSRSRKHSQVQGLDFNSMSTLLSVATDSGTVHLFELSEQNAIPSGGGGGLFGAVSNWIPSVVTAVASKYQVRVKARGPALACVMVAEQLPGLEQEPANRSVYVLTSTGSLLEYTLPPATAPVTETDLPIRSLKVFA